MKNVRKQKIIKPVRIERSRNYLVSELNYHTTKFFTLNLLEIVMRKKIRYSEETCLFRFINSRSK